jgi:hypothetical protein
MFAPNGGVHGNLVPRDTQGMDPFCSDSPQGTRVGLVDVS